MHSICSVDANATGSKLKEVHLSGNIAGTFFTGRAKQLLRKIIHLLLEVVALPLEHSFLIPVKKVFLEPSEEERICSKCGKQMDQIGTEFVRREFIRHTSDIPETH